jgi:hypothetical protein
VQRAVHEAGGLGVHQPAQEGRVPLGVELVR